MIYSHEVEKMCTVAQGVHHGAAPIPEEAKWVQAKEVKDISGLTHGIGWCAPQQGACKLTLNVKDVNEELNKAAKVKLDLNARNGLSIKDANTIEIKATEKPKTAEPATITFAPEAKHVFIVSGFTPPSTSISYL